jgi:hypothetical protein
VRVLCAWCQYERRPALLREVEPLDDPSETHGICLSHQAQMMRQLAQLTAAGTWRAAERSSLAAAAEPGPARLREWADDGRTGIIPWVAAVAAAVDREGRRCSTAEAEQARLEQECRALCDAVARARAENQKLREDRVAAARLTEHLLDDALARVVQPLHDLVRQLRATRPA